MNSNSTRTNSDCNNPNQSLSLVEIESSKKYQNDYKGKRKNKHQVQKIKPSKLGKWVLGGIIILIALFFGVG